MADKNNQIEDIFAETDKGKKAAYQSPRPGPVGASSPPAAGPSSGIKRSKAPFFILLIFIIIILLGIGWLVVSGTLFNQNKETVNNNNDNLTPTSTTTVNTTTGSVDLPTINSEVIDSDSDGLTDEEEAELGTSPDKEDTDSDGLFDREEVKVYKTNPLKKDTDGDGNMDGLEVANGYNPNGAGQLFNLQSEMEKL